MAGITVDLISTIASIGQAGSFLAGTIALIVTLLRTRKSAFEKEVSTQIEMKVLKVNSRIDLIEQINTDNQKLIMQEINGMRVLVDFKLDAITDNTEKAITLITDHLGKN